MSIALKWRDAWNRHDMKALAALVAEDVHFITVGGTWLKSRQEFEKHHAQLHELQFKESVQAIKSTEVKFIKRDVAMAHVEWSIKGDKDADGASRQPRQGIFTWVLEKRKGLWILIASQNTNIREPVPSK